MLEREKHILIPQVINIQISQKQHPLVLIINGDMLGDTVHLHTVGPAFYY